MAIVNPEESTRIRDLERKVELLTYASIVQVIGLAYLLGLLSFAILCFLLLLPLLFFTHKRLPAMARRCGRWFSFIFASPRP
ncbi:MAG TPA: hypothetical protein VGM98_08930 [Schlesneria sp.]